MNDPEAITIERITGSIGAVLSGLDLRRPLAEPAAAKVRRALLDHGAIFLHDQDLDADQYWAFMELFGVPQREESTGSDKDAATDLLTGDLSMTRYSTAVWHADTTSLARPPIVTALRAVEVPAFGGDTCFANVGAAFEALSEPMQRMLGGLTAVHSIDGTIARMGQYSSAFGSNYAARHEREQVHPVVLVHPETGRKGLYVSECFATRIVELEPAESTRLLEFLTRHIARPEFTMRWKWRANDLAIWDNRAVQHYAVPDYTTTRRMQRIVIAGVKPGEPSKLAARRPLAEQPA
jgi:taurine dioxygenase